jgi:hypothetical protein
MTNKRRQPRQTKTEAALERLREASVPVISSFDQGAEYPENVRGLIVGLDGACSGQNLACVRAAAGALLSATHRPAAHRERWITADRLAALRALAVEVRGPTSRL